MQKLHPLVKEVLFTREQIQKRTKEIAKEVEHYYKDKPLKDNSLLVVGLLVFGIGLSLGGTTGYAINPARDLGPRLVHTFLP
ncbi:aquaporin, partial [Mycoplasma capricolum]|uniref:aquaporin n=1 Tax=Mycoplasma capricolum TaxID=2095 RepID=UPI0034DB2485